MRIYKKENYFFIQDLKTGRTRRHQSMKSLKKDIQYFQENKVLPRSEENWS